jgi:predicted nuclease of predicted toxin-antitoxin system
MARLYADEQFPRQVTERLRELGHDVVTVQEAGQSGQADPDVFAFAVANQRAVLTQNRRDFVKLHQQRSAHAGIVVCSENRNFLELAARIDAAITSYTSMDNQLIRVTRPLR